MCCLSQFLSGSSMIKKNRSWRYSLCWLIGLLLISSTTWAITCHSPTLANQDRSILSPMGFGCHSQADSRIHRIRCIHDNQEACLLRRKATLPDPNAFASFAPQFTIIVTDFPTTNTCFTDSVQPVLKHIFLRNSVFRI